MNLSLQLLPPFRITPFTITPFRITPFRKRSISKNKVSLEKYNKTIDIHTCYILKIELLCELLLHISQKLREKIDRLCIQTKQAFRAMKNTCNMRRQCSLIITIFSKENNRILKEQGILYEKLYLRTEKQNIIQKQRSFIFDMTYLEEFVFQYTSVKSNVSDIDLNQLSKLPSELILIIREYLPIQLRMDVLENTWNLPFIEYIENNHSYDTITHLLTIMTHCDRNSLFCNHQVFHVVNKCKLTNKNLYNFTVIFDALILLMKSFYPTLAYTVLTFIKNKKINILSETLLRNYLQTLYNTSSSYYPIDY